MSSNVSYVRAGNRIVSYYAHLGRSADIIPGKLLDEANGNRQSVPQVDLRKHVLLGKDKLVSTIPLPAIFS